MNVFVVVAINNMENHGNMEDGIVGVGGIGNCNFPLGRGFGVWRKLLLGYLVEMGVIPGELLF